jgi:antitoxin HicB
MDNHYSLVIEWSDEDQTYVVSFPEFSDLLHTHGDTLVEAAHSAQEVLELVIESRQEDGRPLPEPIRYDANTK